MTKAGFTVETPAEIYEVKEEDGGLTLYCPYVAVQHRGNTLDGGLLTVRITSTAVNTVSVRLVNHMGRGRRCQAFRFIAETKRPRQGKRMVSGFCAAAIWKHGFIPGANIAWNFCTRGSC